MSFSNQTVKQSFDGDGVQTVFPVTFYYLQGDTEQIKVELWSVVDPDNPVQLPFALNVEYSINDAAYPGTDIITLDPVPTDHKLLVYRQGDLVQGTAFFSGAFPAESTEEQFDKTIMLIQEIHEKLDRAVLVDDPNLGGSGTLPDFSQIDQNATDIANLQTRVTALEAAVGLPVTNPVYRIASTETYNAAFGDTIVVETADVVTINLPSVVDGSPKIVVKFTGNVDNKIVNAADGIDGNSSYVAASPWVSVTFVCDSVRWYIV